MKKKINVLIVDDDQRMVRTMVDILKTKGFKAEGVFSGFEALEKVKELLRNPNLKEEAQKKRERILKDKIDVTKWMTNFILNYPNSFKNYQEAMK